MADFSATNMLLNLDVEEMPSTSLHERRIVLDRDHASLQIGRASKVQAKGFVAAVDNAWFDSPVMSRNHAEIVANFDEQTVHIRDVGSLHGTFLNTHDERIPADRLMKVHDGDKLTFGIPIWRNSEAFTPTNVKLGIRFATENPNTVVGSTFAVPEDVDDDDSSDDAKENIDPSISDSQASSEVLPNIVNLAHPAVPPAYSQVVDLTEEEMGNRDRTVDCVIDLTTPPCHPVSQGEKGIEVDATSIAEDPVEERSDAESVTNSIHLTDNEDDADSSCDDSDDEITSSSGRDDATDNEMEDDDLDLEDDYSSSEDASVEDAVDIDPCPHLADKPAADEPARIVPEESLPAGQSSAHPVLAVAPEALESISHSCAQTKALNYYDPSPTQYTLPSLLNPTARQASPSDAALPKRCIQLPLTSVISSAEESTAEVLGPKTGKFDFFAARVENRLRAIPPPPMTQPPEPGSAQFSVAQTQGGWRDMESIFFRQPVAVSPLLAAGDAFLASPTPMVTDWTDSSERDDDLDEPASAFEFQKRKLALKAMSEAGVERVCRRTHVGIPDIVDDCPREPECSTISGGGTGKRKADEISSASTADKQWECMRHADRLLFPGWESLPPPDTSHVVVEKITPDLPIPAPQASAQAAMASATENESTSVDAKGEVRAKKRLRLRNFAEKLGYAALGGATVGAAIVTTLIYTAPSFT